MIILLYIIAWLMYTLILGDAHFDCVTNMFVCFIILLQWVCRKFVLLKYHDVDCKFVIIMAIVFIM